tara:strand:+ start:1804 stop:2388 length:585 start_codon:yes stop_codon:yes gene_type:complete
MTAAKQFEFSDFGLDERQAWRFDAWMAAGKRGLVVGGEGTGKSTFLQLLTRRLSERHRVFVLSDAVDFETMMANRRHMLSCQVIPSTADRWGRAYDIATSYRPDRIVISEVSINSASTALQVLDQAATPLLADICATSIRSGLRGFRRRALLSCARIDPDETDKFLAGAFDFTVLLDRSGERVFVKDIVSRKVS